MVDGNHDVADVTRRVVKISQKGGLALNGNRVGNVHPDGDPVKPASRRRISNVVRPNRRIHAPDGASGQSLTVPPAAGVHVFQPCRLELPVPSRVFPGMRIREENCNMVLLAAVTLFSVAIAGGAALVGFADNKPVRLADRMTGRVEEAPSPDQRIIYVSDQPPVRVVGAPFVPNTNPRER
jgi:hypothetical protein